MGAHNCSHIIKAATFDAARQAAEDYQRHEQHENGHGPYTGHLGTAGVGVTRCPKDFTTAEEAEQWILDHHNKWDLPYLSKIGEGVWLLAGWCAS